MKGSFVFNGVSSESFNAYVFDVDVDGAPATVYNPQAIPGKNGELLISDNRMPNRPHVYSCIANSEEDFTNFRNFLFSQNGYGRLEDSFHADEYYMAYCPEAVEPIVSQQRGMFGFEVRFSRKPQRFLKSGEEIIAFTEDGTISNPTFFPSRPLLRVYGIGTLTIGHQNIIISDADEYTDIDCELMDSFKGTEPKNEYVRFTDIDYPVIETGEIGVVLGEGITRLEVTPRWWKL